MCTVIIVTAKCYELNSHVCKHRTKTILSLNCPYYRTTTYILIIILIITITVNRNDILRLHILTGENTSCLANEIFVPTFSAFIFKMAD